MAYKTDMQLVCELLITFLLFILLFRSPTRLLLSLFHLFIVVSPIF